MITYRTWPDADGLLLLIYHFHTENYPLKSIKPLYSLLYQKTRLIGSNGAPRSSHLKFFFFVFRKLLSLKKRKNKLKNQIKHPVLSQETFLSATLKKKLYKPSDMIILKTEWSVFFFSWMICSALYQISMHVPSNLQYNIPSFKITR